MTLKFNSILAVVKIVQNYYQAKCRSLRVIVITGKNKQRKTNFLMLPKTILSLLLQTNNNNNNNKNVGPALT